MLPSKAFPPNFLSSSCSYIYNDDHNHPLRSSRHLITSEGHVVFWMGILISEIIATLLSMLLIVMK